MIKGMMGPEHGAKATFGSAKAADTRRKKTGSIKTAKLPTSLDELEQALHHEARIVEQEIDGTFSVRDGDVCIKSGIASNAEAWRIADQLDEEAGSMEDRRLRIAKAFLER